MPGKISWLDSCGQESTIHITSDDETTLCGYQFIEYFREGRWNPYRVSRKRGICRGCLKLAKIQQESFKMWSETVPERNPYEIPNRANWREQWKEIENKLRSQSELIDKD